MMDIEIDSELRRLQAIQLEKIKQQFLEEAFAECPEDAERFEFEDIGEQCLVYPKGEFKIHGFFHYKGDSYRMIVTFWGGQRPWVELLHNAHVYQFRSVSDAVAFCKNYKGTPSPGYAALQERVFGQIAPEIEELIRFQLKSLSEEDRADVIVEGYSTSCLFVRNHPYWSIFVEFRYKDIPILMGNYYDSDDSVNRRSTVDFKVRFRMKRGLCSLAEAIEYIKTNPEYVEQLEEYEEKHTDHEEPKFYKVIDMEQEDLPF